MQTVTNCLRLGRIFFQGEFHSSKSVYDQIDSVASFLDSHSCETSPIVYLKACNHIKFIAAFFAIIKTGRVCLIADPEWKAFEWAQARRQCPPCAIITIDEATLSFDLEREIVMHNGILDDAARRELEEVCVLFYTAADDGYAKAAMLKHENLMANARSVIECNHLNDSECSCSLIPFGHLFALQSGLLAPALCGGPICILGPKDLGDMKYTLKAFAAAQVEHLYTVPLVFHVLANEIAASKTAPPNNLVSGGYKMPISIRQTYRDKFGRSISEGYGLTEGSPVCSWHRPEDAIRPESVGRAFSCCELRICGESEMELPRGAVGEVCVRGKNIMKGYFREEKRNSTVLKDGWLRTGDLGRMDDDGFLYLTGLRKRMINACGKKVYPAEVERFMQLHKNVVKAEVFGVQDRLRGEVLRGRVELATKGPAAEAEFRAWCTARFANYKIPSAIEYA